MIMDIDTDGDGRDDFCQGTDECSQSNFSIRQLQQRTTCNLLQFQYLYGSTVVPGLDKPWMQSRLSEHVTTVKYAMDREPSTAKDSEPQTQRIVCTVRSVDVDAENLDSQSQDIQQHKYQAHL